MKQTDWMKNEMRKCENKVPYSTKQRAKKACAMYTKKYGKKFIPYKCAWCHRWHMTTKSRG